MLPMTDREDRFWSKVRIGDGCWEWTASCHRGGYGQFRDPRKNMVSHRVAWEFLNGQIPPMMDICHKCDNRKCVRPSHLFVGTRQDNMSDCKEKGRTAKGEKSGTAKLSTELVMEIRNMSMGGSSIGEISRALGFPYSTVDDVIKGRTWRHVQ